MATSWCELDLTFDPGSISETVKCRKLIVGRDIA